MFRLNHSVLAFLPANSHVIYRIATEPTTTVASADVAIEQGGNVRRIDSGIIGAIPERFPWQVDVAGLGNVIQRSRVGVAPKEIAVAKDRIKSFASGAVGQRNDLLQYVSMRPSRLMLRPVS